MANVLVVAELLEGKARKTTLCAVTAAKQIAEGTGGSFDILAIGEGAAAAADELAGYGAGKVLKTEIAGGYTCEKYAATVAEAAKGYDVTVACASAYGKDLLPRVAAKLDAGVASDISAVNVDGGKLSGHLGERWPLPVEVLPFACRSVEQFLESQGADVKKRFAADGRKLLTDQGNFVLDAHFGPIEDPTALAAVLSARAGIVEHGLFIDLTDDLIVAEDTGIRHLTRPVGVQT